MRVLMLMPRGSGVHLDGVRKQTPRHHEPRHPREECATRFATIAKRDTNEDASRMYIHRPSSTSLPRPSERSQVPVPGRTKGKLVLLTRFQKPERAHIVSVVPHLCIVPVHRRRLPIERRPTAPCFAFLKPSAEIMSSSAAYSDEIINPGDIVAVQHGQYGRKEGLVVGTHVDYAGRQIVEVQLEPGEVYNAWYPTVTRVRRTISYTRPVKNHRTVERHIYW